MYECTNVRISFVHFSEFGSTKILKRFYASNIYFFNYTTWLYREQWMQERMVNTFAVVKSHFLWAPLYMGWEGTNHRKNIIIEGKYNYLFCPFQILKMSSKCTIHVNVYKIFAAHHFIIQYDLWAYLSHILLFKILCWNVLGIAWQVVRELI